MTRRSTQVADPAPRGHPVALGVCCGDASSRAGPRDHGRGLRGCLRARLERVAASSHDAQGNPQRSLPRRGWFRAVAWSMCPGDGAPCFAAARGRRPPGGPGRRSPRVRRLRAPWSAPTVWDAQPLTFRATWLGTLTNVAPPVLRGRAIVGTQVAGVRGQLVGGVGRRDSERAGAGVSDPRRAQLRGGRHRDTVLGKPANRPVGIERRYAGWYCSRSISAGRGSAAQPDGCGRAPSRPSRRSQTIAFSAPVGPVVGPTAALRPRALYRDGRPRLGTVRCPVVRCTAVVKVRRGAVTRTRTLHVTGTEAIAPRLQLRPGAWRVTVTIDGGAAAQRRVTVRESS